MRSGSLRQRVQIQTPVLTPDGMGGSVAPPKFAVVATVWAGIFPLTGMERLQAEQITSLLTHEIVIRYRKGIVPKMRIVRTESGAQVFEIHAVVSDDFRNRQLTLMCAEVQIQGA